MYLSYLVIKAVSDFDEIVCAPQVGMVENGGVREGVQNAVNEGKRMMVFDYDQTDPLVIDTWPEKAILLEKWCILVAVALLWIEELDLYLYVAQEGLKVFAHLSDKAGVVSTDR